MTIVVPVCAIVDILEENVRRRSSVFGKFNPITGEGSIGERFPFSVEGLPPCNQFLPAAMADEPLVRSLQAAGSVDALLIVL